MSDHWHKFTVEFHPEKFLRMTENLLIYDRHQTPTRESLWNVPWHKRGSARSEGWEHYEWGTHEWTSYRRKTVLTLSVFSPWTVYPQWVIYRQLGFLLTYLNWLIEKNKIIIIHGFLLERLCLNRVSCFYMIGVGIVSVINVIIDINEIHQR